MPESNSHSFLSRARWLVAIVAFALVVPAVALGARAIPGETVDLQILDISDWHGQLDPLNGQGGAAVLSTYFAADRANHPNTLTLTAGDDVGATPPLSTFFEDTPAILAERMMGIQVATFGNHNFDHGVGRLQDHIDLAASTDPAVPGAPFRYVAANLANRDANISGVEDFVIFKYKGVKVAVIGIVNEEAPTLVFPGSFGTMVPTDSAAAAMSARAAAQAAGANVFIVTTHKGVTSLAGGVPSGELIDFANAVSGFDLIVGDHTDIQFAGEINGQFVVENRSRGFTYSKTILTIHRGTGDVLNRSHAFVNPVAAAVTPDPAVQAMLQPFRDALTPIFSTVIGQSTVAIPRTDSCGNTAGRTCESLVGNSVTDALRETYGTDFAITNSGGLRDALTCVSGYAPGFCPVYVPPPHLITRGEVQAVLPFGNVAVTLEVSGAELKAMLENGVSAMPAVNGRYAQVSGLCFTYDIAAPAGSRVTGAVWQAADGSCTGPAVDLTAGSTYTIAENDFMANGGDGYPNFASRMVTRDIMDQALADWVTAAGTLTPALQGRIVCTDGNGATAPNCPVALP
ncbi:MAG: 5'-nucleotidase C-terminal domain-containing protein [Chloroflexi bacterium]|nr:5'-nucleotidase C-terminal domain-containing protein [Chloroflexota bacterium]